MFKIAAFELSSFVMEIVNNSNHISIWFEINDLFATIQDCY